ncbi:hypothetical protein GCM10009411_34140 [Shewanella litoralis]|uniref:Uncharacterized protein n=1 Tax=Shewanella litoralis TaxID=2282700 RepID=A0ABQ2RJX2_9GAMM|nr:hypothetical protein GCM10009411_34140 [Shewanella litoralis]
MGESGHGVNFPAVTPKVGTVPEQPINSTIASASIEVCLYILLPLCVKRHVFAVIGINSVIDLLLSTVKQ